MDDTQNFTFRLDYDDNINIEKVKEFFTIYDADFTKYLVYEELADITGKLHAQGIIEFKGSDNKIRNKLVKFFKVSGGKYSMAKIKTLENYEVYITKQKKRICSKGYSEEQILQFENASYLPEKKSKDNIKNKNRKVTSELYIEYMDRPEVKTELAQLNRDVLGKIKNRQEYSKIIVKHTVEFFSSSLRKPFARQNIENYLRLYFTRENSDYKEKLIDSIALNFYNDITNYHEWNF